MKIIHINTENAEPSVRLASTAWSPAGLASPHPFLSSCRSLPRAATRGGKHRGPHGAGTYERCWAHITDHWKLYGKATGALSVGKWPCPAMFPRCFSTMGARSSSRASLWRGCQRGWCALGEQDGHAALRTNLVGDNFCNRREMTDP